MSELVEVLQELQKDMQELNAILEEGLHDWPV